MDNPQPTGLKLEISASDATIEDIDQMTRQLLSELRELDVESAELAKGEPAPTGTKAIDPVTIGSIAIAVLPTALPKVIDAIQAWASRGSNRTVKFKGKVGGQAIEFEGSAEDLQKVLTKLSEGKKKR
jgi:hypothetical protein